MLTSTTIAMWCRLGMTVILRTWKGMCGTWSQRLEEHGSGCRRPLIAGLHQCVQGHSHDCEDL
jgi:hypothetical protein